MFSLGNVARSQNPPTKTWVTVHSVSIEQIALSQLICTIPDSRNLSNILVRIHRTDEIDLILVFSSRGTDGQLVCFLIEWENKVHCTLNPEYIGTHRNFHQIYPESWNWRYVNGNSTTRTTKYVRCIRNPTYSTQFNIYREIHTWGHSNGMYNIEYITEGRGSWDGTEGRDSWDGTEGRDSWDGTNEIIEKISVRWKMKLYV